MTHHGPREIRSWLSDMDGVLVHEGTAIPGAAEFVRALRDGGRPFLVLTNNSIFTPRDLRARLLSSGIDLPEDAIWTSALATAQFLTDQMPGGSAYVIGEAGLTTALYEAGYTLTGTQPDFVGARGDAHLLVRGDHAGGAADPGRCAVHRHQPRRHRARAARATCRPPVRSPR